MVVIQDYSSLGELLIEEVFYVWSLYSWKRNLLCFELENEWKQAFCEKKYLRNWFREKMGRESTHTKPHLTSFHQLVQGAETQRRGKELNHLKTYVQHNFSI